MVSYCTDQSQCKMTWSPAAFLSTRLIDKDAPDGSSAVAHSCLVAGSSPPISGSPIHVEQIIGRNYEESMKKGVSQALGFLSLRCQCP